RLRINRACQALGVSTVTPYCRRGSAPASRSWRNTFSPPRAATASSSSAEKCAGLMAPELSHHTLSAVKASRTMNLSLGERPVKAPVRTETAPSAVNSHSSPCSARATSTGTISLWETEPALAAIVLLRVSWSNIENSVARGHVLPPVVDVQNRGSNCATTIPKCVVRLNLHRVRNTPVQRACCCTLLGTA